MFRPGLNAGSHPPVRVAPNQLVLLGSEKVSPWREGKGAFNVQGVLFPPPKPARLLLSESCDGGAHCG